MSFIFCIFASYLNKDMEEHKKIQWINYATEFSTLRYPEVNLKTVIIPDATKIILETFVASKDKERLTLVVKEYVVSQFNFKALEEFRQRFYKECELVKDNYIFDYKWSIHEPYAFNIRRKDEK